MKINVDLFDKYRKSNGYTMQELAKAMGISRSALTRKKNGKSDFTIPEMERYCAVLNVNQSARKAIFFAQ